MEELSSNELIFFARSNDKRMEEVKQWIKMYYSSYNPEPQSALDYKETELNKQLSIYYSSRRNKDEILAILEKRQKGSK